MITAIIIDDEKHCIDRLTHLIDICCKQTIHLLPSAQNIEDGIKSINQNQPQLIFLDVEINDKTGFDLLQQVSTTNFEVIFTTAYNSYALQAIKVSALDYLLKPIDSEDLKLAVEKLKIKISKEDVSKKIDMLFLNLDNANKHIAVCTKDGLDIIVEDEIIRCEASGNYTNIYLQKTEKPKLITKTLKDMEELLNKKNFSECIIRT